MSKPNHAKAQSDRNVVQTGRGAPQRLAFTAPTLREIVPGTREQARIKAAFEAIQSKG